MPKERARTALCCRSCRPPWEHTSISTTGTPASSYITTLARWDEGISRNSTTCAFRQCISFPRQATVLPAVIVSVSGVIRYQRLLWEKPGCALHWPHRAHAKQWIVSLPAPYLVIALVVSSENKWCQTKILYVSSCSVFIRSLFPENLNTDKKGRPTTASSKIKVRIEAVTQKLRILHLPVFFSVWHTFASSFMWCPNSVLEANSEEGNLKVESVSFCPSCLP